MRTEEAVSVNFKTVSLSCKTSGFPVRTGKDLDTEVKLESTLHFRRKQHRTFVQCTTDHGGEVSCIALEREDETLYWGSTVGRDSPEDCTPTAVVGQ